MRLRSKPNDWRSTRPTGSRAIPLTKRSVLVAVIVAVVSVLVPVAAFAHAMLKSSDPADGARMDRAPQSLRLEFSEQPDLTFTRVELEDASGHRIAVDAPAYAPESKRAVLVRIREALGVGTYSVIWRAAGDDGHPTHGRFSFGIVRDTAVAPTPAQVPTTQSAARSSTGSEPFDAESPVYVGLRWLEFTALLAVLGAVIFRVVVLRFMAREQSPRSALILSASRSAARVGMISSIALGATALLRLVAQWYAMHDIATASNFRFGATMLVKTVWGWGWMIQVTAVVIAFVGFLCARYAARNAEGAAWIAATIAAGILAFTPALAGHAASTTHLTTLAILADGLHVMGAGGWLGSLLLVISVGIPTAIRLDGAEGGAAVADVVNAFSPTALTFAGLTAATGVFAAWLHLGSLPAIWQTRYGRTLLLKLGVLSLVAVTGAYNWLRVKPTLGGAHGATRVRRSASIELTVGLLVLLVTAILVATPTAVDIAAPQP